MPSVLDDAMSTGRGGGPWEKQRDRQRPQLPSEQAAIPGGSGPSRSQVEHREWAQWRMVVRVADTLIFLELKCVSKWQLVAH